MEVAKDHVVQMHYTLTSPDGEVLDTSRERGPMAYLHGHGNIIPGLETAVEGLGAGETKEVEVPAKEAYGDHNPELIVEASRSQFPEEAKLEQGATFQAQTPQGPRIVKIDAVEGDVVKVDTNHPLAGVDLKFDVEITDVREATSEEIDHGHIHDGSEDH